MTDDKVSAEFQPIIKAIHDDTPTNPMRAFDRALESLSAHGDSDTKGEGRLLKSAARAALQSVAFEGALTVERPLECLFAPTLSRQSRTRIGVCLLRLLAAYPNIIRQPEISHRLAGLFDDAFEENLYRILKLSKSDQSFKKYEELTNLVFTLEADVSSAVESLAHFDGIGTFRSHYFKKINSGAARVVIHPFLPENIREGQLNVLLSAVESYRQETGAAILDRFREIVKLLESMRAAAEGLGTVYSRKFALKIVENVGCLVAAHLDATPYSKPADVKVTPSEKKYPFQYVGAAVNLSVKVVNAGPGHAFDVVLTLQDISDEADPLSRSLNLGGVQPSELEVFFPLIVKRPTQSLMAAVEVAWKNFDGSERKDHSLFECSAQRSEVDWEKAQTEDPYSLSPVTRPVDLVGRTEILNRLLSLTKTVNVGSAFIRGQKRVGKTSIVKALQAELKTLFAGDYSTIYLEAGDYISGDAKETVNLLGQALCRAVKLADRRFEGLVAPAFVGALAPLNTFLDDAIHLVPGHRFVFILDEFDELPLELYRRGLLGDAFFRTIRGISNKDEFGFVLVGSEKMEYVLSCQGDALNKFTRIPVDYFDKESRWSDFQDLLRRPAKEYLDFSDAAIHSIYDLSAGNPYFAKLVCGYLFTNMVARRDCHVMPMEVNDAVRKALTEVGANSFAHFWEDGIAEPDARREEVSVQRRKVLLSFADCIRSTSQATQNSISISARAYGLSDEQVLHELREFERRQIFKKPTDAYACKVPLFSKWLVEKGYQEIVTSVVDRGALLSFKMQEERERVKDEELTALCSSWGLYLGQEITTELLRTWLNQFKGNNIQRLMFKVLLAVRFYSAIKIREKMREAHDIVKPQVPWVRKPKQPKRRDILVAALGGVAHSGAEYARRYADENQIYPDNVLAVEDLPQIADKRDELKGIVLIDDFIGTGQTTVGMLRKLTPEVKGILGRESVSKFLIAVTGFTAALEAVETEIQNLGVGIETHLLEPLVGSRMVFSDTSTVFADESEKLKAKDYAYEYGVKIEPDIPLGYGNCEAAVVFENKIPNNCLPILWSRSKGWKPIFPRN
jgi:hypothetical protein